ncbi:hypothetical protein RHSIM_Rhsim04G0168100 [Rhododendron simsii]|uniref:Uncharacterized protein n=1 Tax=Rhododendron simsii TaxID=118357 RepID=A0A834LS12_RHOSS|nr:hypothetical protein RHSIM_Rhsim04G0168100 [Rhododendron simsii]
MTKKKQRESVVHVLRERNIGVVIRDEQDINLMRLRVVILQAKDANNENRPTPTSELPMLHKDRCFFYDKNYSRPTPTSVNEPKAYQHSIPHIEESVAMPSIDMDEPEMCHPSMPPRNLEEEFLAVTTAHAPHAQSLLDKELLAVLGTSLAPIHR